MDTPLIIQSDEILKGIPVFFGNLVPVQNLVDYLSTRETIDESLDDVPSVNRDQVIRLLETIIIPFLHF
jgi:uncharacterized protein (DUF433 family)